MSTTKIILAVIVLYKVPAAQSQSFCALHHLLATDPQAHQAIDLIVCDNTPYEQPRFPGYEGPYLVDRSNPGLARWYNRALEIASERGLPWVLLLDQDTTPTAPYLHQLIAQANAQRHDGSIVAIVPKLVEDGVVQSPHQRPTHRHPRFDPEFSGRSTEVLFAFNSGSALRVDALRRIGGFPEEFWLDFLDHATFHLLQRDGGRIFVLPSCLAHQLSSNAPASKDAAIRQRFQNTLDAEHAFYRRYGSPSDKLFHRIRLLKGALGSLVKRRNLSEFWVMLNAATSLTPKTWAQSRSQLVLAESNGRSERGPELS